MYQKLQHDTTPCRTQTMNSVGPELAQQGYTHLTSTEPILAPSAERFVLFPIQYPEVCALEMLNSLCVLNRRTDMEHVQTSPGVFLDGGRD